MAYRAKVPPRAAEQKCRPWPQILIKKVSFLHLYTPILHEFFSTPFPSAAPFGNEAGATRHLRPLLGTPLGIMCIIAKSTCAAHVNAVETSWELNIS